MKNAAAQELARLSWQKRNSPEELQRLKEISLKGVEKRRQNKLNAEN